MTSIYTRWRHYTQQIAIGFFTTIWPNMLNSFGFKYLCFVFFNAFFNSFLFSPQFHRWIYSIVWRSILYISILFDFFLQFTSSQWISWHHRNWIQKRIVLTIHVIPTHSSIQLSHTHCTLTSEIEQKLLLLSYFLTFSNIFGY